MDEEDERREQLRQAQARYRKTHAKELRAARRVANILSRRTIYASDVEELAVAIHDITGRKFARALGRELVRRKPRKKGGMK